MVLSVIEIVDEIAKYGNEELIESNRISVSYSYLFGAFIFR